MAVTRFIDLFSSQLTTGIAFILSGLFFAFLAWWFSRGVRKLAANGNTPPVISPAAIPAHTVSNISEVTEKEPDGSSVDKNSQAGGESK